MAANRVKLTICGANYVIVSEDEESYVQELGTRLDEDMNELMTKNQAISVTGAAVLKALDYLDELRKALDKAGLPKDVRKEADKQLRRLSGMHADSSEANVVRTYLDWLVELPWKKLSRDRLDIAHAKAILDEDHYGLDKIKDRILEFLSVRKLNPQSKGPILCLSLIHI